MSAPIQVDTCNKGISNMMQTSLFFIISAGCFSISLALEFMNPNDVLSLASTSCIVTSSFDNAMWIPLFQEMEKYTFLEDSGVQFGVINIDLFKWPNEMDLRAKENPSVGIKTTDLILFTKLKADRTCLLVPEDSVKLPEVQVYSGAVDIHPVLHFINNFCETYRNVDGSLSKEGEHRRDILNRLFHVEEIADVNMGSLAYGRKKHQTSFCVKQPGEDIECIEQYSSLHVKKNVEMKQCDKIQPPSMDEFVTHYLKRSKPVIIQGGTSNWPAFKKWTNDYFRQNFGDKMVHIKLTPKGEFEGVEPASIWEDYGKFEIPDLVKKQLKYPDLVVVRPASLNIKFSEFLDLIEMVSNGSITNMSAYLEYTSMQEITEDLETDVEEMSFFKNVLRLKHLNIWLSDGNTLGKTHFDPFDNFLCMISGKKAVTLFAPHDSTGLYEAHIPEAILSYNKTLRKFRRKTLLDSTSMVMSPVDILNPDFKRFPKFAETYPLNCTIDEGEVLFMPAFWWHEVQSYPNTKEGRNLAVNFWYDPFLTKEFPCPDCRLDINPAYRHLL